MQTRKKIVFILGAIAIIALLLSLGMYWGGSKKKADVTGKWLGTLDYSSVDGIQGKSTTMVVDIRETGDHLIASMSTPDEGPAVLRADAVEFTNGVLTMTVKKRLAIITARLYSDGRELNGNFKQNPYNLPMALKRVPGS